MQVVVLNTAPSHLVHRVLRDGIVVLDRDPSARLGFEVRLRNEYFDLEPMRRMYRNTSLTRIRYPGAASIGQVRRVSLDRCIRLHTS